MSSGPEGSRSSYPSNAESAREARVSSSLTDCPVRLATSDLELIRSSWRNASGPAIRSEKSEVTASTTVRPLETPNLDCFLSLTAQRYSEKNCDSDTAEDERLNSDKEKWAGKRK